MTAIMSANCVTAALVVVAEEKPEKPPSITNSVVQIRTFISGDCVRTVPVKSRQRRRKSEYNNRNQCM